jgi:epoxyqueuosine reductase QueG
VLHVPIAVTAGLGEFARNGSIITRRFGPRVRLATVTTNVPLVPDQPIDIGVQDLCAICKKCAANCPAQCIPHARWWRRAFVCLDDRRRGKKPNPAQEWLYYKVPGDRSTWTIPKVIE